MTGSVRLVLLLGTLALGGCASAVKLDNVAGSWTCPRIDGVCATIAALDGATSHDAQGQPLLLAPGHQHAPAGVILTSADGVERHALGRSPDQIARIVFAPSVDAAGHYHGMREIYAVMAQGQWIERSVAPVGGEPTMVTRQAHKASEGTVHPIGASVQSAGNALDSEAARALENAQIQMHKNDAANDVEGGSDDD